MAEIRYLGQIQFLTKVKYEELNVTSVAALYKALEKKYGKEVAVQARKCHIIVNNESLSSLNGSNTKLMQDDIISIIPVCAGG